MRTLKVIFALILQYSHVQGTLILLSCLWRRLSLLLPKVVKYRNYKHFSDQNFRADLATDLCTTRPKTYDEFEEIVRAKLDKHAPLKTAIFRGNNKPHMSKELKKAIMVRTRLKNKSNQTRTEEDFRKYRQQRNLLVRLNRAAKRKFFSQLDPKEVGKDKISGKLSNLSSPTKHLGRTG